MPEIVQNLLPPGQFRPVVGNKAAQREPRDHRPAGEDHHQQDREQKAGHGIADNDQSAGPDIEGRAVAHCLRDAEWNGDQIDDQRAPQPERGGDRQFVENQLHHRRIAEEAVAEIEGQIAAHHVDESVRPVACRSRKGRGFPRPARPADRGRRDSRCRTSTGRQPRCRLRKPCGGVGLGPAQRRQHLFDRSAGGELDDGEVDHHDAEQCERDKGQTAQDVSEHP